MHNYLDLLENVLHNGEERGDRTGVGTISMFDKNLSFDLQDGFPAVTTKKLYFKSVVGELLWFLSGSTNTESLNSSIWNEWADEDGELGPVYGYQWRSWPRQDGSSVDQIENVIEQIKENPLSRRHIVSAWNVGQLEDMALPPCHMLFQFYVREGEYLDLKLTQRSADLFLGLPFNIASYATLNHIVSHLTDLRPGRLSVSLGDAHIYKNHITQVKKQLSRKPLSMPRIDIDHKDSISDYSVDDFELVGYTHRKALPATIAV